MLYRIKPSEPPLEIYGGVEAVFFAPRCPDLLEKLKKILPAFFALHCFGTRSNKGFGSFTVASIDGKKAPLPSPEKLTAYLPDGCKALYYIDYEDTLPYNELLNDIQGLSAIMKGGMNYSEYDRDTKEVTIPRYYRGAIFYYLNNWGDKKSSEKAFIKKNILPCPEEDTAVARLYDKRDISTLNDFVYVRGLLGIGENFEYKANPKNKISHRRGTVSVEGKEKDENKKPVIGRFENPVHFHPYGNYLLMVPQPIPEKMLGAEFIMKSGHNSGIIKTPNSFDLDDFMQFFVEEFFNAEELNDFYLEKKERATVNVKIISALLHRVKDIKREPSLKGGN